jgi:hypothetical protein
VSAATLAKKTKKTRKNKAGAVVRLMSVKKQLGGRHSLSDGEKLAGVDGKHHG